MENILQFVIPSTQFQKHQSIQCKRTLELLEEKTNKQKKSETISLWQDREYSHTCEAKDKTEILLH